MINWEYFEQNHKREYDEIVTNNVYQTEENEIRGKVVIDIGANVGIFTLRASELGAKSIVSIDANPKVYNELVANVRNADPNIFTENAAVHSVNYEKVWITDDGPLSKIVPEGTPNSRPICTLTLEEILRRYVKPEDNDLVLKLDCEGSEWNILTSTPKDILKRFKTIYVEFHGHEYPDGKGSIDLKNLLKENFEESPNYYKMLFNEGGKTTEKDIFIHKYTRKEPIPTYEEKLEMLGLPKPKEIGFDSISQLEDTTSRHVLAFIPTKGRYETTLPITLISIANQTRPPDHVIIYDDNDNPQDLRNSIMYRYIFQIYDHKGITWEGIWGSKKGQHFGHEFSQQKAKDLVWRLDDDVNPEPNVLASLLAYFDDPAVGAVGGSILTPGNNLETTEILNNEISTVFSRQNIQWYKIHSVKEVDHLHCSFLYKKGIANYNLRLSPVAHTEETQFSYEIKRRGYKVLVVPNAVTWHLKNPEGGIRSFGNGELWTYDRHIFEEKLIEWNQNKDYERIIALDNGIGDHYAFKNILPELKAKYPKLILATCYPGVFHDEDVKQISIAEAHKILGSLDFHSVYGWMGANHWEGNIVDAYRRMWLD